MLNPAMRVELVSFHYYYRYYKLYWIGVIRVLHYSTVLFE